MKLQSLNKCVSGDYDVFTLVFERDGDCVTKMVHWGGAEKTISVNAKKYLSMSMQRAAREADRDLAYRKHGDKFRDHCELTSNFWGPLSEQELEKFL